MSRVRVRVLPVVSIVVTLLMLSTTQAQAQAQSERPDALDQPSSVVGFTITASKIFKVRREGHFRDFTGQVAYDPERPASAHVDLTVFTASVDMHNSEHDQLLKSGAFFDVDHYPTMRFSSSSTDINADGTFSMTGDMTIRGVTRQLTIPVSLRQSAQPGDASGAVFETTFQIDRTEFGLDGIPNWGGFKVSISKTVQIHIAMSTAVNDSMDRLKVDAVDGTVERRP